MIGKRNLLPLGFGVFGIILSALLLSAKGPQVEAISFVDSNMKDATTEPLSLSKEKKTHFKFVIRALSNCPFQALELLIGTYDDSSLKIKKAEAVSVDGKCLFRSMDGSILQNNSHLRFSKVTCEGTPQEFLVSIEVDKPANMALWSYFGGSSSSASTGAVKLVNSNEESGESRFLYGFYQRPTSKPDLSKLDLLNYVWDLKLEPRRFLAILCAISFSFFFFLARFLFAEQKAWAGSLAWFFLSAAYALLTPPFQAPDEPDHMLAYSGLYASETFSNEMLALAQRGHFERIKFHSHHKFSSSDINSPLSIGWAPHIAAADMKMRSPLTSQFWWMYSKLARGASASWTLLLLRLFHASLVSLAFYALLRILEDSQLLRGILAIQLFIMPALPFFGMHVSNYFVSLALTLIQCGFFLHVIRGKTIDLATNFMIGFVVSVGANNSATGISLLAIWGMLVPWCILSSRDFAERRIRDPIKKSLCLTGGMIGGLILSLVQILPQYKIWLSGNKSAIAVVAMIVWIFCLSSAWVFFARKIKSIPTSLSRLMEWSGKSAGLLIVIVIFSTNVMTAFRSFSVMPNIEDLQQHLKPVPYILASLKALLLSVTLSHMDHLFSASFWVGFGWLEAYPPDLAIFLFRLPLILGTIVYFWNIFRDPSLQGIFSKWVKLSYALGIVVMLCGLVAACSLQPSNVHGRYLVGFYLSWAALSSLGWQSLLSDVRVRIAPILVAFVAASQGYCWWFLMDRYF